jgi:hypothetical protein
MYLVDVLKKLLECLNRSAHGLEHLKFGLQQHRYKLDQLSFAARRSRVRIGAKFLVSGEHLIAVHFDW